MSSARPLKVFLAHASLDKASVRKLYYYLKQRKIEAWLDSEILIPGQNWRKEIPKAIENSDAILVCLSKDSVTKEGYFQKEIKFALDKADEIPEERIFLIPVRLEECDVPDRLSALHYVNLFEEYGHIKLLRSLQVRAEQVGADQVFSPEHETKIFLEAIRKDNEKNKPRTVLPKNETQIRSQENNSAWNIGVISVAFFMLILLMLFWKSLVKPMQIPSGEGTPTPAITNMTTFSMSPTGNSAVSETPTATGIITFTYTPSPTQEPSATSTTVPPIIQPTTPLIVPTIMPPTIPPTIAPTPTYTPTRQVTDGGEIVFDSPVNGKWQVFSINPDGSDLRQLTNVLTGNGIGDPAISPDGRLVVFIGDDGKALYIIRADGTQMQSIYQTAMEVGYPSWSFDSQKIVFSVKANGYKNLYVMNADGNGVTRLTDISADDVAPVFSPDGSQIVFSSTRSGRGEIYKLFISSGQIIKLTNLGDPEQIWPSWSPDGLMIAFESRGNLDKRDVFTMYADGTQVKNITNSPKYEGAPVWSPDGTKISFASDRDGGLDIYIMQSTGEQIQRLTTIGAWGPSWSFTK
jgi:Tol biopolymer transport system component